ncbi:MULTISPECIES: sirohydrochlorin chelatase [Nocardiopsis]|uniref:CbiX/SirB N-terminal domain-containing protein n=1 Tax=Nocardiopsis lambiniae TaxID=3075539 RepID=A0ABU2M672_9ACTN|nr:MULTISPECIES: CbiX/SirB N-terminal domain-containing protein [unclassified Nocardiopsis]MDE3721531.1 CbiX/SirB N-terminal domain-containing protein [Nocardiopsis sp. N85]MDT0327731.1 CbiX/SirB N-terminal domain-containing protein [Nocardiopsis sp. DSM 44743]
MVPTMVLVADDSRDAQRREALCGLAEAVANRGEAPVKAAFGSPTEVAAALRSVRGPKVVVPAFVAGGDVASAHLLSRLDLGRLENSCHTPPLGAVPSIVADLATRLSDSGWSVKDGVVLAADGTTGTEERQVVMDVARMLSRRLNSPVQVGYLRTWAPSVFDAVDRLRRDGQDKVAVAAWRLVDGPDFDLLRGLDATAITAPLWPSDLVVDTLLAQHRAAKGRLA